MPAVQPLPAQQRADLTRPRARLHLSQDPQLVLRREPPPQRPLDQLRVSRGAHAARFAPLAYGSLREPAGNTISLHLQHRLVYSDLALEDSLISRPRPSHTRLTERGRPSATPCSSAKKKAVAHRGCRT